MKQVLSILSVILIVFGMSSCVENNNSDSAQGDEKAVSQTAPVPKDVVRIPSSVLEGEALITKLKSMLDPEPYTQVEIDKNAMINYAIEHKMNIQEAPGGLYYVVLKMGDGINYPPKTSKVEAHYSGTLLDGTKFDSSYDRGQPLSFPINRVIVGWQIAIPMLSKGTKATFLIPSGKAYGGRASGAIPANSPLVFDIELLGFK